MEVERRRKEPKGNIPPQKLTGCDLGADFERNPPPILAKQMEGLRLTRTGTQVLQHPSQKIEENTKNSMLLNRLKGWIKAFLEEAK